ncbi:MAG TPA: tRNA pseudouridine(38-40) synthase TruA, partial [Mycobacterium sp.]
GEHRRPVSWCRELLSATDRSSDYATAPAHGLTLVGVDYPPDDQLAARNLITRDVRAR